jgi:hypothetical protein
MRDRFRTGSGRSWLAVSAAAALGVAGAIAADGAVAPAHAQEGAGAAGFTLSVAQLRINQRISQAAVRRSNRSLELLDPLLPEPQREPGKKLGWSAAQLRDDAVTTPKLAEGAVTEAKLAAPLQGRLALWAVVDDGTGALVRAKGATAAAKLDAPGRYTVTFARDVSGCAYTVTPADPGTGEPPLGLVAAAGTAGEPRSVTVRTADATGKDVTTIPFQLVVSC